jgi:iron complex outermembrane recepter protein
VSGEFNIDVGESKLTSITAYRKWQVLRDQDVDFSGIDRAYRDDYKSSLTDFTQEIRLQGSAFGGALDFLIGGFYLNETNRLRDTVRIGNDGNRYVDFALNGATRSAALPSGAQFYGSFGVPTLQQVGAAFQGLAPLPAGSVPLFGQVLYLQNPFVAPGVRLQQIAAPGSALFNLLNAPLPAAAAGQGNNNDDFEVKTNAFAIFTHNIVNLTDKLTLTIGARYNYEKKDLSASINNNLGSCAFFDQVRAGNQAALTYAALLRGAAPGNALFNNLFLLSCNPAVNTEFNGNYEDDRSDRALTGTVKLAYKFTPDVLGYASYDRGFKSGGYNLDQATFDSVLLGGNGAQGSDLAFGKEKVDSYEVGFKTQWGREFTFNIAAFYAKYQDLQNLVFAGNNFIVQNISDSTSKGVEVESIIRPVREWTLRLGYTFNDVKTDEDVVFPVGSPLEGSQGQQLGNVPKHVVSIASTWTPRLSDNINGLLHVDMRYNSNVNIAGTQPNGRSIVNNPGYPMINARVGVTSEDRTKSLEFFVENLTNQYFNITGFPVPEQTGNFAGYPSPPRFYGLRARFGF